MRMAVVVFFVGVLLACVGLAMIVPLGVSIWYADGATAGIGLAMLISVVLGVGLAWWFRPRGDSLALNHRDGLAIVGLCWVGASIAGSLPYILGGGWAPIDALFESSSGFTTTGATILTSIQTQPHGLLMWRSLTHWMGGMGIIVLSLAILPFLGVGGMQLYKAEVPGPSPDKLTPRIHDTAMLLWKVYVLLTVVEVILLLFGDMDLFGAVNHAFATVATGGFSTMDASVGAYDPYVQWVITVFMFAAGINFTLHFKALTGRWQGYRNDTECITYALVVLVGICAVAICIAPQYDNVEEILRLAAFQVVSICTTTGFGTANYEEWPQFAQGVLIFFMFAGGCAGSTSGGIKFMRLIVLTKVIARDLFQLVHPHSVRHLKMRGRPIAPEVVSGVLGFFLLFMLLLGTGTLLISIFGVDLITAFSATLTCLSNVGPGLGNVGPANNFAHLPDIVKIILSLCMLLGRLEIYAIVVFFLPAYWRR